MSDGNLAALQKYEAENEKRERCFEHFLDCEDSNMVEIQGMIKDLLKRASDVDGYDFSEDIREIVREMI